MRAPFLVSMLLTSLALAPSTVVGQTLEERQAELARKKEEARKKADERRAKAAAAGGTSAGGTSNSGTAGTSSTASAGKSSGGAGGAAATATGGAGGAGGKGGAGGAAGKGGAGGAGGATTKAEKDAPLPAADIETLRKDRPDRRKTTVERLRKRWGSLLANDKGASDLKLHARRVAFLQRIRVVAEAKKDAKTIEAVDELLTREDERHAKAMNALREGALPSGASQ